MISEQVPESQLEKQRFLGLALSPKRALYLQSSGAVPDLTCPCPVLFAEGLAQGSALRGLFQAGQMSPECLPVAWGGGTLTTGLILIIPSPLFFADLLSPRTGIQGQVTKSISSGQVPRSPAATAARLATWPRE